MESKEVDREAKELVFKGMGEESEIKAVEWYVR